MNTDKHWELHAQENPYWAVVTWDKFKGDVEKNPELLMDFFATGQAHIDCVLAIIRHSLCADFQPRNALDFGCGVGRLIVPMAEQGIEVSGVDISDVMLTLTRRHLAARSLPFAYLCRRLDDLPAEARFDFVHSFIVLQHIRRKRGIVILDQLLSRLSPGGVAAIHLTYRPSAQAKASISSRTLNRLKSVLIEVPRLRSLAEAVLRRRLSPPIIMDSYPLNDVMATIAARGLNHVHLRHSQHDEDRGLLIFARRSEDIPHSEPF
ncbi:MAG: methyltransferase domain-containing protein [Ilumatobacteraceae bacterium]